MKILSFSYCFPNEFNKNWGIFVYNRLNAMSKYEDLKVCSPVPFFPLIKPENHLRNKNKQEFKSLEVYRPGFFYIPKFFKNSDASMYSRGIKKWFFNLMDQWKPDILDAHFIWPDGVGIASLAKEAGIPYSITLRGKIYECLKVESQKKQCEKALKEASSVISVSGLMAKEALKLGADEKKVKIIPNGVDKNFFCIMDKGECRKKLGLPINKRILVTIAHLGHRKGHFEVIKALKELPEDIILVLVGGEAQGGTIDSIKKAARENNVLERVIVKGSRPYEEIPFYFGAADASVLASYREGCPNAVLESLSCGTPVVATNVGAVPDILPPEAGEIVELFSHEELKNALLNVLNKSWNKEEVVVSSGIKSWDEVALEVISDFSKIIRSS
ncbi:MAG: glycosyltransferase [Desulforegulaceae bacterium]|nr:glycosyltransferase [Desulforegulaceae bacterium]